LVVQVVDVLVDPREDRCDADQPLVLAGAGFRDLENLRLRLVEQLPDFLARGRERRFGDLGRDLREATLHRALAHQLRIATYVERTGGILGERGEVRGAAGLVLVLARLDRFRNRDDIRRPRMLDQLGDVPPDAAVVVAIEVVRGDQIGDAIERLVVDQQRPEERLLRLYRVRRYTKRDELRVSRRLA